jgi:hypothetical protein
MSHGRALLEQLFAAPDVVERYVHTAYIPSSAAVDAVGVAVVRKESVTASSAGEPVFAVATDQAIIALGSFQDVTSAGAAKEVITLSSLEEGEDSTAVQDIALEAAFRSISRR